MMRGIMHAPAITRHRRPFLAPIWVGAALVLGLAALALGLLRAATLTTVIVVSQAEPQPGGGSDPPPAPPGELRAQRLAHMFGEQRAPGIGAIYVAATRRARLTAAPLAQRLGLAPVEVPAAQMLRLDARIRREHRGGEVLAVVDAVELPRVVSALSGRAAAQFAADAHDTLYVVTLPSFGPAGVVAMKY